MEFMKRMILLVAVMALGIFVIAGCDKEDSASHAGHDHGANEQFENEGHDLDGAGHEDCDHDKDQAHEDGDADNHVGEQTLCPVMGNSINKELFTEYKGKKVYFCCPGCDKLFNEDPEKYLAKLPQFGGKEEIEE